MPNYDKVEIKAATLGNQERLIGVASKDGEGVAGENIQSNGARFGAWSNTGSAGSNMPRWDALARRYSEGNL